MEALANLNWRLIAGDWQRIWSDCRFDYLGDQLGLDWRYCGQKR